MSDHIEFLGPSGSGSSTLFDKLEAREGLFCSYVNGQYIRLSSKKYVFIDRVLPPGRIKNKYRHYIARESAQKRGFRKFLEHYPQSLARFGEFLHTDYGREGQFFRAFRKAASTWVLSEQLKPKNSTTVIDEGFVKMAAIALARGNSGHNAIEFLHTVPLPECVIYIDAPVETCFDRQRKRNNITSDTLDEQRVKHRSNERVFEYCRDIGITTVKVDNVRPAEEVYDILLSELLRNEVVT